MIDGASRWKQTWHVTLPGIRPTMMVVLILNVGQFMAVGFQKILLTYNAADLPHRGRHLHVPVPGRHPDRQLQLRRDGRAVRVRHRLGAGSRHQRPLPSSRWVRPVVTAEIAAPAARPAKKRKAGAWPPRSRGYKVFRVVNAVILTLVVARGAAAVPEPARAVVQQRDVHHPRQRQPVAEGLQRHHVRARDERPAVLGELPQHGGLHRLLHRGRDGADHLLRVRAVQEAAARAQGADRHRDLHDVLQRRHHPELHPGQQPAHAGHGLGVRAAQRDQSSSTCWS